MFSLIFARTNSWINNRDAGDLRRRCAHYDVTAMAICIKTYEVPQDCTHSKCQPLLLLTELHDFHYNDVIISAMASQITSLTTVYSTIYSGTDKQKSKPRVTGLLEVNSPVTGELPTQRASNTENVSIWWRHHDTRNNLGRSFALASVSDELHRTGRRNFTLILSLAIRVEGKINVVIHRLIYRFSGNNP